MSLDEHGAYRLLLDWAWISHPPCYLPNDERALARLLGVNPRTFRRIWGRIRAKFELNSSGTLLYNAKQLELYSTYINFSKSQSERAKSRWKKESDDASASAGHMPEGCSSLSLSNKDGSPNGDPTPEQIDTTPVFIEIPLIGGTDYPVTEAQVSEFEACYPAVDVRDHLRRMRAWSISNPKRRKTKRGVTRFINSWLEDKQNKAKPVTMRLEPEPEGPPTREYRVEEVLEMMQVAEFVEKKLEQMAQGKSSTDRARVFLKNRERLVQQLCEEEGVAYDYRLYAIAMGNVRRVSSG